MSKAIDDVVGERARVLNEPSILAVIRIGAICLSDSEPQSMRRQRFAEAELEELAESIRAYGVLQPIVVRPLGTQHLSEAVRKYELVAGERRLLAARRAELEEIPAVVRALTDDQVLEVQLIENLQRADLHPMEEAEGYQQLMGHGHPVEELHDRVGKSRSYVYGRLKLLALCKSAREAFYDGTISASVALLLARIPVEKLQKEALKEITIDRAWRGPMSYRAARDHVHDKYMLQLAEASFPTSDTKLVRKAGACTTCPKRTGNQPELFGEIKSADVCTDPVCFGKKVRAHGNRVIKQAEADGRPTISGDRAKALAPHGATGWRSIPGYSKLDDRDYRDPKHRTVKQLVGKSAERTLLQDPKTGAVVELVKQSDVDAALREKAGARSTPAGDDGTRARRKKAKLERAFRMALYEEVRPLLTIPDFRDIATAMFERLEHDMIKELCRVRGFEPPQKRGYASGTYRDHRAIGKTIADMSYTELPGLINDMIYVRDLQVSTWSDSKPERLLAAAAEHSIDVAAVRQRVAPAKKKATKKKAAKKTPAKK